jgi:sn-glycerol 3-phosphate transport system permease protein
VQARQRAAGALPEGQQGLRLQAHRPCPPAAAAGHPSPVPSPPGGEGPAREHSLAVEKRVRFRSWWLPWVLLAPQMAIIAGVLLLARGQALLQRAAAGRLRHQRRVGRAGELPRLFADESYLASFAPRRVLVLVAVLGLSAVAAAGGDGRPRGQGLRGLQDAAVWPYAVAPAVAGVLWLFMFAPSSASSATCCARWASTGTTCSTAPRHGADRHGRGVEADLVQLPVLPGRAAEHSQAPDRGRRDRRRRALAALLDHRSSRCCRRPPSSCWSSTSSTSSSTPSPSSTPPPRAGPGKDTSILVYKVYLRRLQGHGPRRSAAQSVVLMVIVVALTVVQFRYVERRVHY